MNSKDLYDQTCLECSKLITEKYSTSFSLGIKAFHSSLQLPIYAIYGLVRYADEIVDTFHDFNKEQLLDRFEAEAKLAVEEKISLNPILQAFQITFHNYKMDYSQVDAFFKSMRMDLDKTSYERQGYEEYIYGSAEVVGLMCLRIFTEGNQELYNKLEPSAKRLGAAFQKINFLRDLKDDYKERGRSYFPGVDFDKFDNVSKASLEKEIKEDFKAALVGIKQLPDSSRLGVYLAYRYYWGLFKKIQSVKAERILTERIRISDSVKYLMFAEAFAKNKLHVI